MKDLTYIDVLNDYTKGVSITNRKEFKPYYSILQSLIWDNEIDKFNEVLKNINIKESSIYMMVSILRTGYIKSDVLESYNQKLAEIGKELDSRGKNSKEELNGLNVKLTKRDKDENKRFIEILGLSNNK